MYIHICELASVKSTVCQIKCYDNKMLNVKVSSMGTVRETCISKYKGNRKFNKTVHDDDGGDNDDMVLLQQLLLLPLLIMIIY